MSSRSLLSPRNVSLAAVCIQSTALAIVLHLSQSQSKPGQQPYKASSAVLITELGKLFLSFLLALRDTVRERRLLRRPVHNLPSPELYASGEEVHQGDLYKDDPYDVVPPYTPVAKPLPRNSLTTSFNNLRRRSSALIPSLSITFEGKPVDPSQEKTKLRFPELATFAWPRPSLSPVLDEKEASPELLQLKSDEPVLWKRRNETIAGLLYTDVFGSDWWKMALPAVLFAIQNNLIYVAARNLSVPVFQITFQLKTLITALAAVLMLGRRLSITQWISLVVLGLGVATMQIGAMYAKSGTSHAHAKASESVTTSYVTGISSILVSCICSAVAATYFELCVKRPVSRQDRSYAGLREAKPASLWVRNIQLSLFSTAIGLVVAFVQANPGHWNAATSLSLELDDPMAHWYDPVVRTATGFFLGFQPMAWLVIFLQTVGGLLIAVAIKKADNVAKGFALAVSIVFTFLLSVILFDFKLSPPSVLGGLAVVGSTLLFEIDDSVIRGLVTGGRLDPYRKPVIKGYHYVLLVVLGVTFFAALMPSRRFSVTTAAWDLVASGVEAVHHGSPHMPTIAIADMDSINNLMVKGAGQCGWSTRPHRETTWSAYGAPKPAENNYPYWITTQDQYSLDDILTTRFKDYQGHVPLLGQSAPDFIYLPVLSQLYSNPWNCDNVDLADAIRQTTAYIRQIVASVGPTSYPRIILPVATIRSNLERELFTPELMEEIKDSVVMVSIENAPKSYKEGMKYMIDVPYPTPFHLSELGTPEFSTAPPRDEKTAIGDIFLDRSRPYLVHYAAAASHPWGGPSSDPFNGFALRAALHKTFADFVASPPADTTTQVRFDNIDNPYDGAQDLNRIHEGMASSVFCPMPAGDSPSRRAIYEAVLLGCIPVIFREKSYGRLFPSTSVINDVSRYMVYIDENDVLDGESVISRLETISPREIRRMQRHLKAIAPRMQWALPSKELWFPVPGANLGDAPQWNRTESMAEKSRMVQVPDAFSTLLHELDVLKNGEWVAGIARDTRRGKVAQHFGAWGGDAPQR
ncbi:UDP-galactose translocator, glycosyltransferase family 47 protein [Pseudohyphozyma bogoriensis]|nr:UDP-galactose translocator, glycosyltransferase family 47 protein [Pseudohyphozyma bogoriensis]